MKFSRKEILDLLETNRTDLEKQFPDIEGLTLDEIFEYFFGVETTTSTADGIVLYEKNIISLRSKFDKNDIASLNKFKRTS